ncbi:5157_t:CDS:2, partial [Funneliformis mosseae]
AGTCIANADATKKSSIELKNIGHHIQMEEIHCFLQEEWPLLHDV